MTNQIWYIARHIIHLQLVGSSLGQRAGNKVRKAMTNYSVQTSVPQ